MKAIKLTLCAAVATAVMGFAGAAAAQDGPTVSYNIGLATDYVFRGVDQTGAGEDGQVFAGADLTAGQFYAGVWVSNTGAGGSELFEGDLYAGFKPVLGGVTLDLGAIYYGYNGANNGLSDVELKAGASVPAGAATLGAVVYYGPSNNGFGGRDTTYIEGNVAFALGNFDDGLTNYITWNAGVSYPITDKVALDARYIGTEGAGYNGAVATLKVAF
jgi:uncharacterized protein (TIGR02001 family)